MGSTLKSYEELLQELQELKKENESLKILYKQDIPLRQKSEELLNRRDNACLVSTTESDNLKLIHELQVYQIELEMQNEELMAAKDKVDKSEKKIIESENKLRSILENTSAGYFFIDKDGLIKDVNEAWVKLYGYESTDEIIGHHFSEIQKIDDIKLAHEFVNGILNNNSNYLKGEFSRKLKDGSIGYHTFSANPVSRNNELIGIEGFIIDSTEKKRSELALKESEAGFKEAQRLAKIGSWEWDSTNDIIMWSKEYYHIYGIDSSQTPPGYEEHLKVYTEESAARLDAAVKRNIETGEPYEVDLELINPDSPCHWITARSETIRNEQGEIIGLRGTAQDITERKFSEQALKDSERKYRLLVDRMLEGLLVVDNEDVIQFANPMFSKMLGYEESELIGQTGYKILLKESDKESILRRNFERQKGLSESYELDMYKKDGHIITLLMNASPLEDYEGNIIGSMSTCLDITERKKAEEKLLIIYKAIESSSNAIGISDAQGHHFYQNKALSDLFEYETSEEIEALGGGSIVVNDPEVAKEMFDNIMSGKSWFGQLEMITKSGRVFPAYEFADAIKDNEGNIVGLIGVITDISEIKQAENALLESRNLLHEMTSQVPGVVYQFYARENGEMGFYYVSDKSESDLGIKPDLDYYLEHVVNLIIPEYRNSFIKSIENAVTEFIEWKFEGILQKPSGEIIWISGNSMPSTYKEEKIFNGVIFDITDRKCAEMEIQMQNVALAELNASKDKFFSIIAHDLRSPFNGFLGLTRMLAENVSDFSLKELQDISKSMKKSADNLYELLGNLLEWSRMQRGLIKFNPVKIMLPIIVKQNFEMQEEIANSKKILLLNHISENLSVTADIAMLNTVLRNLISNAIKFTPKGGIIEIGTVVQPSEGFKPSEGSVAIYIKDSGIGMSADTISKLFKLDENVSQKGTEGEPSTGLGLILCKEFIEKHGGKIWVESEIGKGSTFYFSLYSYKVERQEISDGLHLLK
jgi:PAS domain S-box-containing protein